MNHIRPLIALAAFAVLALMVVTGCDPAAGQKCDNPGEYYTHTNGSKRVSLSCQPSGIDSDGHQTYKWVKA
jgi:hypothetical protein